MTTSTDTDYSREAGRLEKERTAIIYQADVRGELLDCDLDEIEAINIEIELLNEVYDIGESQ